MIVDFREAHRRFSQPGHGQLSEDQGARKRQKVVQVAMPKCDPKFRQIRLHSLVLVLETRLQQLADVEKGELLAHYLVPLIVKTLKDLPGCSSPSLETYFYEVPNPEVRRILRVMVDHKMIERRADDNYYLAERP